MRTLTGRGRLSGLKMVLWVTVVYGHSSLIYVCVEFNSILSYIYKLGMNLSLSVCDVELS